jgi:integrase
MPVRTYKKGDVQFWTTLEVKNFLNQIQNSRDRAIFYLMYLYGLRASEVCGLNCKDIDPVNGKIYIQAKKNGKSGWYYLDEKVMEFLDPWLQIRKYRPNKTESLFLTKNNTRMSRFGLAQILGGYCKKAGIERSRAHLHALRHSIAVHLASSGTPLEFLKIHLRHKSVKSTMIYYDLLTEEKLRQQKQALSGEFVARI